MEWIDEIPRWRNAEKEPPKHSGEYLVTCVTYQPMCRDAIQINYYDAQLKDWLLGNARPVWAWMPLPPKYEICPGWKECNDDT